MRAMSGAWAVLPFLVLWAGCSELNDATLYSCESYGDCGSGWECRPLGATKVCVKTGSDQDWMNSDGVEPDGSSDAGDTSTLSDDDTSSDGDVPSCSDEQKNNGETGVDCGGETNCRRCDNQRECLVGTDCSSGLCDPTAMVCVATGCANGLPDGAETDVDCGGSDCASCLVGAKCMEGSDCGSGVCTANVCVCVAGWVPDDAGGCLDIDECSEPLAVCDTYATCTNTAGSFTCACNLGYSGDGVSCVDVDECDLNTDNCSDNAMCRNTDGSFDCQCNPGYSGDGVICTDANECTDGTSGCSADATCTNTVGSFTCACNSGYSGDGFACVDVDECTLLTDNCSDNATCTNTAGSFTCACNPGYSGDGVTCSDRMVRIPANGATTTFDMGCSPSDTSCEAFEHPVHTVTLDAYRIDEFEVTAAQYKACVDLGPCTAAGTGMYQTYDTVDSENHPINYVDWMQAFAYCEWLDRRLPTEAEWERAAAGATQRRFPWGDDCPILWGYGCLSPDAWTSATAKANGFENSCHDGYSATSPVGSFPSGVSPDGVYDMAGNVYEWVSDWYSATYYAESPAANPTGPASGTNRVARGGGWNYAGWNQRVAIRNNNPPTFSDFNLGFRCAVSVP